MTLKDLLENTNYCTKVRISIENKNKDDVVLIFKGISEDALKYFGEVTLKFKVEFISLYADHETKAPIMSIVIA